MVKEKETNFKVKKPGKHHLTQDVMEASWAPWQQCIKKGILPLLDKNLVFFPKIHDLSVTMKTTTGQIQTE